MYVFFYFGNQSIITLSIKHFWTFPLVLQFDRNEPNRGTPFMVNARKSVRFPKTTGKKASIQKLNPFAISEPRLSNGAGLEVKSGRRVDSWTSHREFLSDGEHRTQIFSKCFSLFSFKGIIFETRDWKKFSQKVKTKNTQYKVHKRRDRTFKQEQPSSFS